MADERAIEEFLVTGLERQKLPFDRSKRGTKSLLLFIELDREDAFPKVILVGKANSGGVIKNGFPKICLAVFFSKVKDIQLTELLEQPDMPAYCLRRLAK